MAGEVYLVFYLRLLAALFVGLWKSFEKAGVDGWKALIPIYNLYFVVKIAGLSGWAMLGFLIPILNIFVPIYIYYRFARNFGLNRILSFLTGMAPFLALPAIGFSSLKYIGDYKPGE